MIVETANAPPTPKRRGAGHQEVSPVPKSDYKRCCRCDEVKPVGDFYPHNKQGRRSACKACESIDAKRRYDPAVNRKAARRWRAANPERSREIQRRWYEQNKERAATNARRRNARTKFGLSLEEYDAILARPCAICGTEEGKRCLDHDHGTGENRDALCDRCNLALGQFGDDPDRLRAAADYIEKWRRG